MSLKSGPGQVVIRPGYRPEPAYCVCISYTHTHDLVDLSLQILPSCYCLEIGFASLTLCNCFIHKLFNYTSQVKQHMHTRKWMPAWVDKKKSDLVFKVGPGKLCQAACSDLWGWICVICSWEQKLPSQFNSDLNAAQDSYMNIIH